MAFDKQRATFSSVCQCCRLVEWHMCTWQERTYYLLLENISGILRVFSVCWTLCVSCCSPPVVIIVSRVVVHEHSVVYWLKILYVYVYILALLQAWSRTPFHQEVRNLPLQAWMVLRSMEVYILLTCTCIIVWLENMHVYPHRVWVCSKGTLFAWEFECVQKELCLPEPAPH